MEINRKVASICFHSIEHNIRHLGQRCPGCLLVDVIHRGDADVIARPEYLIQRVAMDLTVKSRHNSKQHSDNLELHVVISLLGTITNSLHDRVYKSALRSSFFRL